MKKQPTQDLLAKAVEHLQTAAEALEQHRDEHPANCRCPFCRRLDPTDREGIHADIPHLTWSISDLISTLEAAPTSVKEARQCQL